MGIYMEEIKYKCETAIFVFLFVSKYQRWLGHIMT